MTLSPFNVLSRMSTPEIVLLRKKNFFQNSARKLANLIIVDTCIVKYSFINTSDAARFF